MEKKIFVYENFINDEPRRIGILYVDNVRGEESFSFVYDDKIINNDFFIQILDPDIYQYKGRQYPINKKIFGVFADSIPDRWGKALIDRKERINAEKENRKPNKMLDSDYLLSVNDKTRMGGLRFKLNENKDFVSSDKEAIPSMKNIREIEEAVRLYEHDEKDKIEIIVNDLLSPGSSLGGARPKSNILDEKGNLWIAKFPSKNDNIDVGLWEKVAIDLAKLCGLNVPETSLKKYSKYGSTFLTKRFDRKYSEGKEKRIHFSSAMALLGKTDGDKSASYMDIVSFIKKYGSDAKEDVIELWRRILFNILISNSDDHLRNHGFMYVKNGFRLSPLYDVNPIPYGNELSLTIDGNFATMSMDLLLNASKFYGIDKNKAEKEIKDMKAIISANWKKIAKQYDVKNSEIEYIEPAIYNAG